MLSTSFSGVSSKSLSFQSTKISVCAFLISLYWFGQSLIVLLLHCLNPSIVARPYCFNLWYIAFLFFCSGTLVTSTNFNLTLKISF
eukprot:UN17370